MIAQSRQSARDRQFYFLSLFRNEPAAVVVVEDINLLMNSVSKPHRNVKGIKAEMQDKKERMFQNLTIIPR